MVLDCKRDTCKSGACGQDARVKQCDDGKARVHGVLEGVNHVAEFLFRMRVLAC